MVNSQIRSTKETETSTVKFITHTLHAVFDPDSLLPPPALPRSRAGRPFHMTHYSRSSPLPADCHMTHQSAPPAPAGQSRWRLRLLCCLRLRPIHFSRDSHCLPLWLYCIEHRQGCYLANVAWNRVAGIPGPIFGVISRSLRGPRRPAAWLQMYHRIALSVVCCYPSSFLALP